MPSDQPHRHILIDFENVPSTDLALIAGMSVGVTLLVGQNQKKLGIDLVAQLLDAGSHAHLVRVGATGRNVLDQTLAFYLGKAATENPGAEFFIISSDTGYDGVIKQIGRYGVRVSRHASVAALPFVEKPVAPAKAAPATELLQGYAQKLRSGAAPRSLTTLRKKSLNDLKKHITPDQVDGVVSWLKKEKVVDVISDNKVRVLPVS